ncbi:MAG: flagellar basal body P-ring formation protein FlgA [Nitrospinae bacterium]|nr:flagellar basal body P-ring formation protein FlgA [Nitrospinota bacterium]MBL7021561.1 flagellar basal body P-ring formation protein FlgA [Nitrospinaceae bacterium]
MIIHKNKFLLNFILYACLSLFFAGIATAQQILTAEEIEQGAMDRLSNILPWDKELLDINIYYKSGDILLPLGEKELIYKARSNSQKAGRIPLILQIKVDNKHQKTIRINSRVSVSQKVIKTIRQVKKGELFSNDNIQLETVQTERPLENAMGNLGNALGYEASRNLPSGKILTSRLLKKPALGNRGDKILILAEKGGMKITTPGILKEDGYEDGMVQVLNIETKKTIYGRLVDANTVKVSF